MADILRWMEEVQRTQSPTSCWRPSTPPSSVQSLSDWRVVCLVGTIDPKETYNVVYHPLQTFTLLPPQNQISKFVATSSPIPIISLVLLLQHQRITLLYDLCALRHSHRSAMLYACHMHNVLQVELFLAEERYEMAVFTYKAAKLQMNITRERLRTIKDHLSLCVNTALDELAAAHIINDNRREPWHAPDGAILECPWLRPYQSRRLKRKKTVVCWSSI
ncbi:hypothetical protein PILCRDRAFT_92529 [Piloderma croceum F 1598]|uniref:Uncharacterized protein n=1 Tax=Piloderma croceum (strain F 1598) TaxID=765440 RepID=A0A0C3BB79_PILCF|nr:hypothetical protein PILCRDRAFT_92529 [Piloderma croceum F 1598]